MKIVIKKTIEKESNPAFDIGTYFHTGVLEPHKLKLECAVYSGIRRGAAWEKFKEENANKAIITESELTTANNLIAAVKKSPVATSLLSTGHPEVSAFATITIAKGDIFYRPNRVVLGKFGWEYYGLDIPKGMDIVTKVRADWYNPRYILDLKSTTGNCKVPSLMKSKVSSLNYDLSAAFYLDIFSLFAEESIDTFIWTFASKDLLNCKSYRASMNNILVGRAKWKRAALELAKLSEVNWEIPDELGILEPNFYELEHIKPKEDDLL